VIVLDIVLRELSGELFCWKEKQLFIGGKETLLKVVSQAISVHAMSVFLIPKGVCKSMVDAISQFWWGDDENNNKLHWLAW
jgi:hypothetical protein